MAVELAAGTVIGGRYRLERLLGTGGMGAVWAAEDTATGRRCALKLMKDPAGDPDARKRFLREGRAASAVRHPNVVGILDVIEPEGEPPAIVMELLDGEPLRARLGREPRLPLGELAELMVPVVSAVGAAHALGIVHRDLKPENIFLVRGPGGERAVKVLDFGIAKLTALDGEAIRSTGITTGAVLGTPAYMAPEQVFAEKDLDHRADIWALGIILYECLSGVCPTAGDNVGQVLKHVVSRPFAPLDALARDLPEGAALDEDPRCRRGRGHGPDRVAEPGARGQIDPLARTARAGAARAGAPRPRRARSRAVAAGAAAVVLLGAVVAWSWWPASPASTPAAAIGPSPLDPSDAKLACPILRASGVEAPAGWLGAAAAAVACERARVLLGGRVERTLVPAELLDLPPGPVDDFPADPYAPPEARERSVAVARQRAQAYLDGEVTWSSAGFAVTLSLHRADGGEIKRASGRGRALYEAVRSAMTPLVGPGLIPKASELEPEVAAWSRTRDVDGALAVVDLTVAFAHNAGGLAEECRRLAQLGPRAGELGAEGRWLCAYTLAQPLPVVELGDSDRTAAAVATRIRIHYLVHKKPVDQKDVQLVRELFQRERTSRGRSILAGIEACLLEAHELAREKAMLAPRCEPKNLEGGLCNPWEQVIATERDTAGADSAVRAMQAWLPWNSYAWLELGSRSQGRDPAALPLRWRAYRLSPFDTQLAGTLASALLVANDRTAARGIASDLRAGGLPLHDLESDLIIARVDASMGRFGEALERARRASERSSDDSGWVRVQRFQAAWNAFELAACSAATPRSPTSWSSDKRS